MAAANGQLCPGGAGAPRAESLPTARQAQPQARRPSANARRMRCQRDDQFQLRKGAGMQGEGGDLATKAAGTRGGRGVKEMLKPVYLPTFHLFGRAKAVPQRERQWKDKPKAVPCPRRRLKAKQKERRCLSQRVVRRVGRHVHASGVGQPAPVLSVRRDQRRNAACGTARQRRCL